MPTLALRAGAGIIDLSNFGVLRVEGRDRVTWLHKLITANSPSFQAGSLSCIGPLAVPILISSIRVYDQSTA